MIDEHTPVPAELHIVGRTHERDGRGDIVAVSREALIAGFIIAVETCDIDGGQKALLHLAGEQRREAECSEIGAERIRIAEVALPSEAVAEVE